ncbi:class A sortase [Liquorilactobacillus cacaonum]|uniref:Sortase n=1 Tax=Liquorilactobacillus cacaonum DSM 21116 TaxID=1423729 RepID=A0A0R2CHH7_9LACO|nr:class A sortase [Liquorilactobacillus cacaonum]KRM91134.1 sortase [Liquorilactobacillus cacaonum DSM 21116]
MKKKLSWILVFVLFAVGLTLIFSQNISDYLVKNMSSSDMKQSITTDSSKKKSKVKASFDFKKVKSASVNRVVAASFTSNTTGMIGKIAVPAVGLKLPIFEGINDNNLLRGAGTMKENEKMGEGNYALAGHHMNNPDILFSPLAKAQVGELVYLTDGKKVYTYKLTVRKTINKYQVQVIDDVPNKKMITLITCDPIKGVAHTPLRILLQGELQSVKSVTTNNVKMFR